MTQLTENFKMINSMDIYRALVLLLKAQFTNVLVQVKDIKNPKPPCFYIKPVADSFTQSAGSYGTTNYSYSIIYTSKSETLEDLLTIQEELKKILQKPLKVTSFEDSECINFLEINSVDITLDEDDYFFNALITLEVTQELIKESDDDKELMEIMEISYDK